VRTSERKVAAVRGKLASPGRLLNRTGAANIAIWGLGHEIMLSLPGTVSIRGSLVDKPELSPTSVRLKRMGL